jgi:hypothetical protein
MNERFEQEFSGATEVASGTRAFTERQVEATLLGEGKLRICAWCRKVPLGKDYWVDIDAVLHALEWVSQEMVDQATHGICPDCFNAFLSQRPTAGKSSAAAEVRIAAALA